jgi:predicted metal-dependent phosphoesterase TrpH/glycosyltransferase involved in cell wall biosynthesis
VRGRPPTLPGVPAEPLAIAQVTPFAWEAPNEVGEYVAKVSDELAGLGHRILIIAPSQSPALVRDSRRALRGDPAKLLERADGQPLVLGVGEVLPFSPMRRRAASLPVDVARTIEDALLTLPLDVVHVHEPFAPSAASVALRQSRALNVGSFHAPTERILSTQLTRPLTRLLLNRLDSRTASYHATRELMERFFPADYRVIMPGAGRIRQHPDHARENSPPRILARDGVPPIELVLIAEEERAALRTFLRALRTVPTDPDWRVTIWSSRALAAPATLGRALRERVRFVDAGELSAVQAASAADVIVLASEGVRPTPGILLSAIGAGVVPVASRLAAYEEVLSEGGHGLVFEPGDAVTLAAHLTRLIADGELRAGLREAAQPLRDTLSWSRVARDFDEIYTTLRSRRHDGRGEETVRRRLEGRRLIDVDLHMHTDHSYDCATPVEVLLAEAKARGLGAIAVTDHNEISGALEAASKANGIKVIVGEEVKTAGQGEVIGLFIREKIARGMTLQETIAEIKRQGGIVYVPHPFDRMHSVPDYEHLVAVLEEVDAIEIFNPRVAIMEFNEEAARFAAKYRIPAGAGSDAHVPQGLGSVRIRMRDFDGAEEFLESLRDADIVRNPASLLYVQALKFLQTKALPPSARKASRDRRVRRVARKS